MDESPHTPQVVPMSPCGTVRVAVRPLEPADGEHLADLFDRLSPRSRYLRFFTSTASLPPWVLRHLSAIDHDRHEAVGVFDGDVLVGVAHWFRTAEAGAEADIAVEVADDHQHHGLGRCLLRVLADRARRQGITRFTATTLTENAAVRALLRSSGWPLESRLDGPQLHYGIELLAA